MSKKEDHERLSINFLFKEKEVSDNTLLKQEVMEMCNALKDEMAWVTMQVVYHPIITRKTRFPILGEESKVWISLDIQ